MPEPARIVTAPSRRPATWGLGDAAVGWLVGLFFGQLTWVLAHMASDTPLDEPTELPLAWLALAQTGLWVGLLGAPYVAARFKGNGMRLDFGLRAERQDLWMGGLLGGIGQFAIVYLVYVPIGWFTDISAEEISEPARDLTDRADGILGVVLLVLIVGIAAPIVEEIFYRGLLQRSLIRRVGVPWGIAIASVLFGAAHLQLLQFPALTLVGVLFGVLAHQAGRLGPAIIAHVVFNMAAVIALLVGST